MTFYSFLYLAIAFLMLTFLYLDDWGGDSKKEKYIHVVLSLIWPITILLMGMVGIWEKYRKIYEKKALWIVENATDNKTRTLRDSFEHIPVKDLNTLLYCVRIGAWSLDESDVERVKRILTDKAFEQQFLESKDATSSKEN